MIEIRELIIEARIEGGGTPASAVLDEQQVEQLRAEWRREMREALREAMRNREGEAPWRFLNGR
ncbi:hypothetical protein FJD38_00115 [Pseudomonas saxonica]|uniref:Uncharacterized protein n=1 Tax=Pseudomonas saxonica TaxID=2600598 RepID=A0ABY3GLS1_9PSED|nr:DUF5908 family protein [Pseudomonas saxonica]TWR92061.1 hypothetical protein FJD38_00115 [Pseudomonas saxonica]